jgi:hypothetical protein
MIKSTEDPRYPQKDEIQRLVFKLKAFKVEKITNLPVGLVQTGDDTIVTFYMNIEENDVLYYDTLSEEIA